MIKEVIVVEGRADEARIRACRIEADTIRTDGFNLLPHTLEQSGRLMKDGESLF